MRILYLSAQAQLIQAQLQGQVLLLDTAGELRDDISTDEITPVSIMSHFDEQLARFVYTGLTAGGQRPIAALAVQNAGFEIIVAGQRYGKGSSREHSPAAERFAGIRIVFARSFERIYRQNADNIGLITCTDFSLLERIEQGQNVSIDELLAGREMLAKSIQKAGGLLQFGYKILSNLPKNVREQLSNKEQIKFQTKPQTLFEKIVSRHLLGTEVTPERPQAGEGIFVRTDWRFIHEYYTGMAAHLLEKNFPQSYEIYEKSSVRVFEDHSSYIEQSPAHLKNGLVPNMQRMRQAQRDFVARHGLVSHITLTDEEAQHDDGGNAAGISHAMMIEHYALPGQLITGTDSHTPHSGALGCLAYGVGTSDMALGLLTGAVRMNFPEQMRIELTGQLPLGVCAKDVMLQLLARPDIRAGAAVGKAIEFSGSVVQAMSIDERATLTNMSAELGGATALIAPDAITVAFLKERRDLDFSLEDWMYSDTDAYYASCITLNCSDLEPWVAAPGDPGQGQPLSKLEQSVKIDIAYGGSCTAGKREDFDHYHAVLAWGLQHGITLPAHVTLYLQYGTTAVRDYCSAQGYSKTFEKIGARILQPSCGACANCGPGSSESAEQVTVSAINRNFPGRSGPGQVWLASPATVMASALAGRLISFEQLKAQAGTTPAFFTSAA